MFFLCQVIPTKPVLRLCISSGDSCHSVMVFFYISETSGYILLLIPVRAPRQILNVLSHAYQGVILTLACFFPNYKLHKL